MCCVCLDFLSQSNEAACLSCVTSGCVAEFHIACIRDALHYNSTSCPQCRRQIDGVPYETITALRCIRSLAAQTIRQMQQEAYCVQQQARTDEWQERGNKNSHTTLLQIFLGLLSGAWYFSRVSFARLGSASFFSHLAIGVYEGATRALRCFF